MEGSCKIKEVLLAGCGLSIPPLKRSRRYTEEFWAELQRKAKGNKGERELKEDLAL